MIKYTAFSACRRGRYHISRELPCQDKICTYSNPDVICVSLADGAGSRILSDKGAEIVTKVVSRIVGREFDTIFEMDERAIAERLIDKCLEAFTDSANVRDYASTLLFLAGHSDGRYVSGHLGDGVQMMVDGDERRMWVLSHPENGRTPSETFFVTSSTAKEHFRIQKGTVEGSGFFVMMSDGPSEVFYDLESRSITREYGWFAKKLLSAESLSDNLLINELQFVSGESSDDLSIAVISWNEVEGE